MQRALVEIGAAFGASVLVMAGVLAIGGTWKVTPPPVPAYVSQRPGCLEAPVFGIDSSGVAGSARLCILDEGARPVADVEGLTPGTAYVTWFAYFDRPQLCQKSRCTLDDLRGEYAVGVSGRMDGIVADGFHKAQLRGDFRDLRLTGGAEATILVFERAAVAIGDTRARARQLLTVQLPGLDLPATDAGVGGGRLVARAVFDLP
jgi:hypothetical protein